MSAQREPFRSVVTNEQVFAALQKARVPTESVEIAISAAVTASVPRAELEITSMSLLSPRMVSLRLGCVNRAQCIPFFASVTWPKAVSLDQSSVAVRGLTGKATVAKSTTFLGENSGAKAVPRLLGEVAPGFALKQGTFATLLLEDGRIHIRLQVVCQQNGGAGDKIRVMTPDHKSYLAEVLAPSLLRGDL